MRERAWAAGIVGGLAVVAVLAFVVFRFGRLDPSPPSLQNEPNAAIPGEIVFVDEDNCVIRTAASGAWREEVLCDKGVQYAAWTAPGRIGVTTWSPGMSWFEVDLETGERTPRTGDPPRPGFESRHGVVLTPDGEVTVSEGTGTRTIADFDLPESGSLGVIGWSPDDEWLLLNYHRPRGGSSSELWILSRDGSVQGTLATDAFGWSASWWIEGVGTTP